MGDIIAGLVLGGIPIVLWALEQYHEPVKSYWRYDETLSTLRDNLFVQREQLSITLKNIGLHDPNPEEFNAFISKRFPDQRTEYLSIVAHMDDIVKDLMIKLDIDVQGKPKWTDETPERATWEWRRVKRALGSKTRKSLIDELQYWNGALAKCFEKQEIPLDDTDPMVQKIQSLFDQDNCDSLRSNAQAIHRTIRSGWACNCSLPHRGSLEIDWHGEKRVPTTATAFSITLSYHPPPNTQVREELWQTLFLKIEKTPSPSTTSSSIVIPTNAPCTSGVTGKPQKRARFSKLFKKTVSSPVSSRPQTTSTSDQSLTNQTIATLDSSPIVSLCDAIQTGDLSSTPGFIPDPDAVDERRVTIRALPRNTFVKTKKISLDTLLAVQPNHRQSPYLDISRKQRFGIAAAMTWAVLHLAGSPWLNSSWDKEDVHLFLEKQGIGHDVLKQNPSLSCLFNSTLASATITPTASSSTTMTSKFQSAQIRNHVIFSLGVLLIELCLPCSFAQLRQEHSSGTTNTIDDYEIALSKVDKVYLEAGDSYGYAVQRCLRLEFPGRDVEKSFDFRQFRQGFYCHVVAPVQAYYVRLPSSSSSFR